MNDSVETGNGTGLPTLLPDVRQGPRPGSRLLHPWRGCDGRTLNGHSGTQVPERSGLPSDPRVFDSARKEQTSQPGPALFLLLPAVDPWAHHRLITPPLVLAPRPQPDKPSTSGMGTSCPCPGASEARDKRITFPYLVWEEVLSLDSAAPQGRQSRPRPAPHGCPGSEQPLPKDTSANTNRGQ
ncbi:hypothetical protein R6Z07F_017491 [Ovis aries]